MSIGTETVRNMWEGNNGITGLTDNGQNLWERQIQTNKPHSCILTQNARMNFFISCSSKTAAP